MSEQSNQLAPRNDADDLSIILPNAQSSFWCSIKPTTESAQAALYRAREGESQPLADLINAEIVVQDVLVHPVSLTRDNGETIDVVRIVLISPDGSCYSTCSSGIQQSIRTLCQIYGLPPWQGGRRFKVKQLILKNARRTFKLEPIAIAVDTKGTKK